MAQPDPAPQPGREVGTILSVNVGRPREVEYRGRKVSTGIFKEPVAGSVRVAGVNLEGDAQADLRVHGGPSKSVYAYPSEHYAWWRAEFPEIAFPYGALGENLTTQGFDEPGVCLGDHFRCGTAELIVTQPRMPCFKLGIRLGDPKVLKAMLKSRKTGFYFTIAREGQIQAGDPIERLQSDPRAVTIEEVVAMSTGELRDRGLLQRALEVPALPEDWKDDLVKRLALD